MDPIDKDAFPPETPEVAETSIPRAVRWLPSDLERIEKAAAVLSARERLSITAADIIRRGALKETDEILSAA
jgi:hypothetical protein